MAAPTADASIFLLLPSYRDPECHHTLRDLFEKAAHPERIFVGLIWQYDAQEDAAYLEIPYPRSAQVRARHFTLAEAKGAGWARAEAMALWNGEPYVLQIQSHSRFEPGWDVTLIDMLARCPSEKPVLCLWPPNYTPTPEGDQLHPRLHRIRINAMGGPEDAQFVHLTSDFMPALDPREGLYPTPWWIGCFMFARAEAFRQVPADPHIFFWGEELAYSARLYTHGYDLFQNDRVVLYHQWFRTDTREKQDYRALKDPRNIRALKRIRHLLGLSASQEPEVVEALGAYGLGSVRPLADFLQFAGIDLHARTATPAAKAGYFPPAVDKAWGKGKIFVQIPSYRDPECQHTLRDLFEKAARPENIYVGIVWQIDAQEGAACFTLPSPRPAQTRELRFDWRETQGVCWARWQAQSLWRGEEYTLHIDSHMRFVPGWDEKILAELAACDAPKPVLSCCIARYTPPDALEPAPKPSVLRAGPFNHEGNIRNRGAFLSRAPRQPLNAAFISGGFVFARSEIIEEVPYDPYLHFEQEEICYALRLFTHGWDVFSGRTPFVYHHYIKADEGARPLPWLDIRGSEALKSRYMALRERGVKRMNHLTGHAISGEKDVVRDLHLFGLGKQRSLREFENYAGLDFVGKRVSEHALRARFVPNLTEYVSGIYVPEMDDAGTTPPALMTEEERLHRLSGVPASVASAQALGKGCIFVQIASYRDPECQHTVRDLFEKAAQPERIYVGICWQFDENADKAFFAVPAPFPKQLREKRIHHSQARGANWARAVAQSLWQGEEYTLQIDSHMRFEPGWDDTLIAMLARTPQPGKSAITAFLPGYTPPGGLQQAGLTRIRVRALSAPQNPAVVHLAGEVIAPGDVRAGLYPTPFLVGNFLFAHSQLFRRVPVDPHIFFHGDEIAHSARLWTHGYTLYQPDAPVAYHHWAGAEDAPYKRADDPRATRTLERVRHLLGLELSTGGEALEEMDRYAHGTARDLESLWKFANVDPAGGRITPEAEQGIWNLEVLMQKTNTALPRIFVQIASYRDPECQHTVQELFANAAHPERIFVGIVWQFIAQEDAECFAVPYPRPEQVRVTEVDARESLGVCWARALGQKLWQGEEYTLQIDSHMRFEPGWDDMLIDMLHACDSPKPVLSTYPAGYVPPREIRHRLAYRLVAKQFDKDGIFTMASRPISANPAPDAPVLGAFAGACMLFGPAEMIAEVPYDPHLYFFGEEITLSVRLWTHGYDIFHPPGPVVYHYWDRKTRRTHFEDHRDWPKLNALSFARVRHLLGTQAATEAEVLEEIGTYGLGSARSLEEYQQFSGVDFARRHIAKSAYDGVFPAGSAPGEAIPAPPQQEHTPRKVMETKDFAVYDNFLPQPVYDRLFEYISQMDYQYINTQGKVKRVWDLSNGFPLRSDKTVFYYAEGTSKPDAAWVYPSKSPFDMFIDHINAMVPKARHLVGKPGEGGWEHFSVTSWLYPPNTGLSMHDDGAGIYTGAYVFFMNNEWRPHWGGLLIVLDYEANQAIQARKKEGNAYKFHMQKWLHLSSHDEIAMERGLGQCVFPKANRVVFIHPDAFHLVTQVTPSAGDHVRKSLAGFFHRGKKDQKKEG